MLLIILPALSNFYERKVSQLKKHFIAGSMIHNVIKNSIGVFFQAPKKTLNL